MEKKLLYRSNKNKVFAGICGGIGEYFEIDPTLVRVLWIFITVFTGFFPGLFVYIFCVFIIPKHGA